MPTILFNLLLLIASDADTVAAPDSGLNAPVQIAADGVPIDIAREGAACPLFADFDQDGLSDLLVGEAWGGRLRIYRNIGTKQTPEFGDYEWFRAGGTVARVPWARGGYKGFSPQMVDLDGDRRPDIVSGCYDQLAGWVDEFHWFRRIDSHTFAPAVKLTGEDGQPIQLHSGALPACADWNGDGRIDLVIGALDGRILFLENTGTPKEPRFAAPVPLTSADKPIEAPSKWAHPCVADWDADGDLDLLVAALDGSVVWYPNRGSAKDPQLNGFITLVLPSPVTLQSDKKRPKGHTGKQPAVAVADFNGDGRADLLLGDGCGQFQGAPPQSPGERRRSEEHRNQLAELRTEWAGLFRKYRQTATADRKPESRTADELRKALAELNSRIAAVQEDVEYDWPRYQTHGFVWVFLRDQSGE
jgi:hypothetical protein